jgi:uncharacterized protein
MRDASEEWPETLDIDALLAAGWAPAPFREFVLKVNSRCDLACDYCYVYTMADQSWRDQPTRMAAETIDRTAERIGEHVRTHRLPYVRVILHGGEPLLAGPDVLSRIVLRIRAELPPTDLSILMQTNGVRLTSATLRLLDDLGIQVTVSMDGGPAEHDRHRKKRGGAGSHAEVSAALHRLSAAPYRRLFRGLLCTIDLSNDPVTTYEALLEFDPPAIDFLLPHGNWSAPPPYRPKNRSVTPYADWLIAIFDRWYDAPRRRVRVRIFEEVMHLLLQGTTVSESLGLEPVRVVVVETDGSLQQSDFLKSAFAGAPETGRHVSRNGFDDVLLLPGVAARQLGATGLSATCRSCRLNRVCGGGLYAHRYLAGEGFDHPSVYCPDLFRFITHIRQRLSADLAKVRAPCSGN